jgi:hypothetical protein
MKGRERRERDVNMETMKGGIEEDRGKGVGGSRSEGYDDEGRGNFCMTRTERDMLHSLI